MKNRLYLAVTPDKYELPLAVADNVTELAKMLDIPPFTIYTAVRRNKLRNDRPSRKTAPSGARFYVIDCLSMVE